MSRLLDIQHRIQDTNALIHQLQRELATRPQSRALAADIGSLERRREVLLSEFQVITDVEVVDVCAYRMFKDNGMDESIDITGFSSTLIGFQDLVSVAYDAIKNGAKQRKSLNAQVKKATQLDFGFAYAGSLGVVMTVPNQRLMDMETRLDDAVALVFRMAQASSAAEVNSFAQTLGAPVVRALYEWSSKHAQEGLGAEVKWQRSGEVKQRLQVSFIQMVQLAQMLSLVSDEKHVDVDMPGVLVGADVVKQRFRFVPDAGGIIQGSSVGVIDQDHQVTVPKRYRIKARKTVSVRFATEKEAVSWQLLGAESLEEM